MGSETSKEQEATSTGEVINNVKINQDVQFKNDYIITLLCIIAGFKILELLYKVYSIHRRYLQKKYSSKIAPLFEENQRF